MTSAASAWLLQSAFKHFSVPMTGSAKVIVVIWKAILPILVKQLVQLILSVQYHHFQIVLNKIMTYVSNIIYRPTVEVIHTIMISKKIDTIILTQLFLLLAKVKIMVCLKREQILIISWTNDFIDDIQFKIFSPSTVNTLKYSLLGT